jgi:DNA-binding XRE family transcriptional regulator
MARPSKFKEEYIDQARKLCKLGATDRELADFFEVSEKTLNNWKLENEEFLQSLKIGKDDADNRVERSLFARATGYEHPDTDIRVIEGQIVETPIIKRYPPDTTAAIFWLKNRKREEWRDKVTNEHTGADGGAIEHDMTLTVSFVKADKT